MELLSEVIVLSIRPGQLPRALNRAVSEEAAPDLRVRRRGIGVQNAPGFSDEPS